jgi:hypothetical protein
VKVTGVEYGDTAREIDVAPSFDVPDFGVARAISVHLQ